MSNDLNSSLSDNPHLSEETLQAYLMDTLSAQELRSAESHLGDCADCRERVQRERNLYASYQTVQTLLAQPPAPLDAHLPPEQIAAFVNGDLEPVDHALAQSHFELCRMCRAEQQDLAVLQRRLAESPVKGSTRIHRANRLPLRVAALSAVAAIILLVIFWPRLPFGRFNTAHDRQIADLRKATQKSQLLALQLQQQLVKTQKQQAALLREQQQSQTLRQERTAWQQKAAALTRENATIRQRLEIAAAHTRNSQPTNKPAREHSPDASLKLRDGSGQALIADKGAYHLGTTLPEVVAQTIKQQRLPKPPIQIAMLQSSEAHRQRDEFETKDQFHLISPAGIVSLSDRPLFAWSPHPTATRYQIDIYDTAHHRVDGSGPITETSWTPATPLPRGQTYRWQVTALKGEDILEAQPKAPAPMAPLFVLDTATHDRIVQAQQAYADSPLTLGILYAQAGMLEEAERALQTVAAANPASPLAQQLLRDVRSAHKPAPDTQKRK